MNPSRSPGFRFEPGIRQPTRLASLLLATLLATTAFAGCGGDEKEAKDPTDVNPRKFRSGDDDEGGMGVSSDVGGLNDSQTRAAFRNAQAGFKKCLMEGWERIEFLGGEVHFYVALDDTGTIKANYLEETTLGDRATERCMLDVISAQKWPKAVGGEIGEARSSLAFDPPEDVRPPVDWSVDDISQTLAKVGDDLDNCKRHASPGRYSVTMYIGTNGSPISVGVAPPNGEADLAIDCIVGVLRGATFPSPGSWPAKVTFDL